MKNLKKILALVLVMAVVFSFTAMTASAAFTDEADIARKEAVDVMAAIGVINGYTDGTFKPKGEVTRAEMAKMITVLLNKGEDVGELYKGAVTFADSASHWAAGYIAYCAQEKIINGRNNSTFDPNANVTGTEAAKMLLCALGYDPAVEGLTGASWASNTLSLAKKCEQKAKGANLKHNLLVDMDTVSMTTPLSRENAAQMILNAMDCTMVDYDGNAQTITIGNTSFTTGATLLSLGTTIYGEYEDLAGAKRLSRSPESVDDFGRPAVVWTLGGEDIGSYSDAPVVTYKDAVQGGKVYTDLGKLAFEATQYEENNKYVANNKYVLTVLVDGADVTNDKIVGDTNPKTVGECIASGNIDSVTPAGSWTEIYVDDDYETVTMVIAKYYFAQIANVVPALVDANNDVTREAYVTLRTLSNTHPIPTATLKFKSSTEQVSGGFITDAFTAADRNVTYVVYTKALDKSIQNNTTVYEVQSLVKAEVKAGVAGAMSQAVTANGTLGAMTALALDSTSYPVAKEADVAAFTPKFGTNATIYLDPNGNILYGEGTSSDSYAFVLTAGQTRDEIYGGVTTGANLLFTDGTTKRVNVYNENGNKYTDGVNGTAAALANTLVSYYVNAAGEYVLEDVAATHTENISKVLANDPTLYGGNMFANDSTTYIVETRTTDAQNVTTFTYTTYTGLKTVPSVEEAAVDHYENDQPVLATKTIAAVATNANPNYASYVFVVGGKVKDTSTASVSVFMKNTSVDSAATDANNVPYFTTKAVVDGEIKSVKMTQNAYTSLQAGMQAFNKMVIDANGYVSSVTVEEKEDFDTYVLDYTGFKKDNYNVYTGLYNGGIITMANGVAYSVNPSVPVFVFDTTTNALTQTTIDVFSTTLDFAGVKVVLDSAEKLLNKVDVVSAIYVTLQANQQF